jgi:hypothetical protein
MVKIVVVLAVVGLIAPAVMAGAATPWITKASFEGQTYRRPNIAVGEGATPMHGMLPHSGGDVSAARGGATNGPMLAGDDLLSPRGGALVTPSGGGPLYTPQQQGDRQIELLIDRLG